MTASAPVLLITGPVGAGKSTVAAEAARLLCEANIPHALVDLAWLEQCWPVPADDPWNERLIHRNLACLWANFRQAGAARLILESRNASRASRVPHGGVSGTGIHAQLRWRPGQSPPWSAIRSGLNARPS